MLRLIAIALATSALVACPGPAARPPTLPEPAQDDTAVRIQIARAEARRGGGEGELIELATHGKLHERALALRGLGRIGGPRALGTLRAALGDHEPTIVAAAAAAIGVTASLDELDDATTKELGSALVGALANTTVVVEAIGRAGDAGVQPRLVELLADSDPRVREVAALALGRHGRRKIAITAPVRAALAKATADRDPGVRYAATWALAREHEPPVDAAATDRLIDRLLTDDVAEVRAQAALALARRKTVERGHGALEKALTDRDWRVVVEAVRALAGDGGDAAGRDAVMAAVEKIDLQNGRPEAAHVVIEALRLIAPHMATPHTTTSPTSAITTIASAAVGTGPIPPVTRRWVACLSLAALVRANIGSLAMFTQERRTGSAPCPEMPDHLRLPLAAELITAKAGTLAERRDALRVLLSHADARVRAAGIGTLPAVWAEGDAADHRAAIATLVAALGSADAMIVGAATEASPALFAKELAIEAADRSVLEAAIVARATREREPEIAGGLFELIGKQSITAGLDACRAGLTGHPIRVAAARGCLKALGEPTPAGPLADGVLPPVDVADVIGKRLRWHMVTSRGEIVIGLRPDVAPWAVATIVALTRKGFYDGLELHRVVPDFVVQGGDPTMSGSGGPGFAIPSEPGTLADGPGYAAGGVGIADSGRDSGGSQWFIMHARAPHLDGRYTWCGTVESGQKSADALQIGDVVEHARIEVVH